MKKKDKKKLTVYPHPRALEVLGGSSTDLNKSLEWFAELISDATNKLDFERGEMNFFADISNGSYYDSGIRPSAQLLAQAVDAMDLDRLHEKWELNDKKFRAKLNKLSDIQALAVIVACQFFWAHHETINTLKMEWWTIPFRRHLQSA